MDFYSNLSSPLVFKPYMTGAQGSLPPQPPWSLSRPKEERPLLRPNTSGTSFNLGGPGSFPRRDSVTRISFSGGSNSESSIPTASSTSSIDPYSSPITAEDLRNRYMRDLNSSQTKHEDPLSKPPEKTYMSSSPNPFLVNSFLKRQGSFLGQRASSTSSLAVPNSAHDSGSEDARADTKKSLVETGVLRPRRASTATSRLLTIDMNHPNASAQGGQVKADGSADYQPPTNPMTMFSVMTKKPPQRMVEHSTSVFANPQTKPISNSARGSTNFTSGKHYGAHGDDSFGPKEFGDGAEIRDYVVEHGDDFRASEALRMPVTGTMPSTAFYPRSSKCEDLIYRPQSERPADDVAFGSSLSNISSESLYDKVKREVENHRKARQLALERERETDERQKQILQTKLSFGAAEKEKQSTTKPSEVVNASPLTEPPTSDSRTPAKSAPLVTKPPMVPTKESAPMSLSSTAGSLQKAILPNRTLQQTRANLAVVSGKPVRKNSLDRSGTALPARQRLNVSKRGSGDSAVAQKKEEACEDEGLELGERQPGDGEAEVGEDERTIKTEFSRSGSRCSSVNSIPTEQESVDDGGRARTSSPSSSSSSDDDDGSARTRPGSRPSTASSRASTPSKRDSDSDDDLDASSDDDDLPSRSHSRASRRSRSESGSRLRSAKSRCSSVESSDDEEDEDDAKPTRAAALRRSRSASRVDTATSEQLTARRLRPRTTVGRNGAAKKQQGQNPLIDSCFDNVPPCIRFVVEGEKIEQLPWKFRKFLIWRMSTLTPVVVKQTIWRSGFRASKMASVIDDLETHETGDWIGYFGKHMKATNFKSLREYQKYNHYPGSHQLGRKDRLWQNLHHMQQVNGKKEYNFFPQTFCLPMDAKLLKKAWDEEGGHKMKWILKPPASARGQGIRVVHQWCQIPKKSSIVVQKYLSRPFLINESKFDLRVYVYVPSFDPLRIYVHEDGLVRFASQKYSNSVKNLANRFMHLTNYSINKQNTEYQSNSDDSQCQGHKWSLRALWSYMRRKGHNTDKIWEQIKDIVVKTIISVESHINTQVKTFCRRKYCVHELFGFDILLDESLQPWVLECNISPSLHSNSKLDINIKGEMIKDMFNLAGYQLPDRLESGPPPSSYTPSSDIVCDRRLWHCELGSDEKAKQTFFVTRAEQNVSLNSILDIVTPEDLRMLVEAVDEFSRAGSFQLVFPTPNTRRYLKLFEKPRYGNLLLHSYVQRFSGKEKQGVTWLNGMCQRKVHLQSGGKESRHRWRPTAGDSGNGSTTSNTSSTSSSTAPASHGDRPAKFVTRAV